MKLIGRNGRAFEVDVQRGADGVMLRMEPVAETGQACGYYIYRLWMENPEAVVRSDGTVVFAPEDSADIGLKGVTLRLSEESAEALREALRK